MHFRFRLLLAALIFAVSNTSAQQPQSSIAQPSSNTKIELQHADLSEFGEKETGGADRLSGNVVFKHEEALMYCDTAYLYRKENRLDALGNVRIMKGSFSVSTLRMQYNGN